MNKALLTIPFCLSLILNSFPGLYANELELPLDRSWEIDKKTTLITTVGDSNHKSSDNGSIRKKDGLLVPPQIECPGDLYIDREATCGATVYFKAIADPTSSVTYSQSPGTFFPLGQTTVTATATNSEGTSECTFTVSVGVNITLYLNENGEATITENDLTNSLVGCNLTATPVENANFYCDNITDEYQITHSHGGGFNPNSNEFWYPQWKTSDIIYRYDRNHNLLGSFNTGQQQMMQLWMDNSSQTHYYTANWDDNTITKRSGNSEIWSYDMGKRASAVSSDHENVYALGWGDNFIRVLNKNTGSEVTTIPIPGFVLSYGGLAAINDKFYIGGNALNWSAKPTNYSYIHELDSNGNYLRSIPAGSEVFNMAFDGETIWSSPNSNTIYGTKISDFGLLTAEDSGGNVREIAYKVIVVDDEAPTIQCSGDVFTGTEEGLCFAVVNNIAPIDPSDNCSTNFNINYQIAGATTGSGVDDASGTSFNYGISTVTYTIEDKAGNRSDCQFDVIVNEINTISVVSISPGSQQYSDSVTFEVMLTPGECPNAGMAATDVIFSVGTQEVGSATLSIIGEQLIGTLDALLTELPSYPSNGQMEPGIQQISARFVGVDPAYNIEDASTTLTITPEDCIVKYTGPSFQATANSGTSEAIVKLSANIQDITISEPDSGAGDIRNAKVKFVDRNGGDISGWLSVDLLDTADETTGYVDYDWPVNILGDSQTFTVGIIVDNGYYQRDSSEDDAEVTIYIPNRDTVKGDGTIISANSAGKYASSDGQLTDFKFKIGYNKKGNTLKGDLKITYRRLEAGGIIHEYEIKSKNVVSMGLNNSGGLPQTANFIMRPEFENKTIPLNPIPVEDNLFLRVFMSDYGDPGSADTIAFILSEDGTVLYSSNWTGINVDQTQLSDGNLEVSGGFSTTSKMGMLTGIHGEVIQETSDDGYTPGPAIAAGTFEAALWPVPSVHKINLELKSRNDRDPITIQVFDVNRRLIEVNTSKYGQPYAFGKELPPGIYFVKITQALNSDIIQVIKY